MSKIPLIKIINVWRNKKMEKKVEKVIDSILNVLIVIVDEILKNQKQENKEKRD